MSQEGDNELIIFLLLIQPLFSTILDLRIADSTKDTKVDQPVNYSHLLRLFEGTQADL